MNTDTSPALELADLILAGGDPIVSFVNELGCFYDGDTQQLRWINKVVAHGIVAGASLNLLRWLILRDFNDRDLSYDLSKTNDFIDLAYTEHKTYFDRHAFIVGVFPKMLVEQR